jgi:nucleoside-diphosphate-sugar epimerase
MQKILVTGALGQIGTELVFALRQRYGQENVIASDVRVPSAELLPQAWPFEFVDVGNAEQIEGMVLRYKIDTIYHLAALLSATAEAKPQVAWELNMGSVFKVLEVARKNQCAVFVPSSIGAFGEGTPKTNTPQDTIQRPSTMYGVTKVAGELLCDYYFQRFGVDTRGLRFPGLISHSAPPGGGTTDYAVDIFYQALRYKHYSCFLRPDTRLDMMYMPDALGALIQLMEADPKRLLHRNAFNVTAMNFTPEELAAAIRKHIPDFQMDYQIDPMRQKIADSWPDSLDDSAARAEWDWSPHFDLEAMTADMLENLRIKLRIDP